jgi:hypothetical protein
MYYGGTRFKNDEYRKESARKGDTNNTTNVDFEIFLRCKDYRLKYEKG